MKNTNCTVWEPCKNSVSRWRAWCVSLLVVTMLGGFSPVSQAADYKDLPELDPIEVRPLWQVLEISRPVPKVVKKPAVRTSLRGTEVRMLFSIGKDGQPFAIGYNAGLDYRKNQLGKSMKQSLRHWEFQPSKNKKGEPVTVRVRLPVKVVRPGEGNSDSYASLKIEQPVLVAVLEK